MNGKATFAVSRHLGEENPKDSRKPENGNTATKRYRGSENALPLRVTPDSYVFTDADGKPIDQAKSLAGAFRVCCECSKLGRDRSTTPVTPSLASP
jgi:hypothetical protein